MMLVLLSLHRKLTRRFARKSLFSICLLFACYSLIKWIYMKVTFETTYREVLSYRAPFNASLVGKPFDIDSAVLASLNIPLSADKLLMHLDEESAKEFVFVSAGDAAFYMGSVSLILTIQKYMPGYTVILYDLGFTEQQREQLSSACNVQLKYFYFEKYPEHVKQKLNYAWKPLMINEVLQEYPGMLWLDSSGRITSSQFGPVLSQAVANKGAVMLTATGHSNYAVTHPQMFEYLPSRTSLLKKTDQWETHMLLYRTPEVYGNVIKWLLLCALNENCIAPTYQRYCNFPQNDRYIYFAQCHRFDQSAVNILMANHFNFHARSYYATERVVETTRTNLLLGEPSMIC